MTGGLARADTLRFDIKTAQTKQLGFRVFNHGFKALAGIVGAAFQHGSLRFKKLDQWLLIRVQKLGCLLVHAACGLRIACTRSNQSG
ncbi:hypothetical protein D3C80_847570 [compost metagenome]